MKRKQLIPATVLLLCLACILYAPNLGYRMATSYFADTGGASGEITVLMGASYAESIRLIAGMITAATAYFCLRASRRK